MKKTEGQIKKQLPRGMTPWKKGQSGNPKGRPPKTLLIPDILRGIGSRKIKDDPFIPEGLKQKILSTNSEATKLEALHELVYWYALKGESWAVTYIAERTEEIGRAHV